MKIKELIIGILFITISAVVYSQETNTNIDIEETNIIEQSAQKKTIEETNSTKQSIKKKHKHENLLVPGQWTIQFAMGQDFTITSYMGAIISAKKQRTRHSAWRHGLSFSGNLNFMNLNANGSDTYPSGTVSNSIDINTNSSVSVAIAFKSQYLYYVNPDALLNLYLGIGPLLAFKYEQNKIFVDESDSIVYRKINEFNEYYFLTIGAEASLGVEWFVAKNISLAAEYSVSLTYDFNINNMNSKREISYYTADSTEWDRYYTTHTIDLNATTINLILSLYI